MLDKRSLGVIIYQLLYGIFPFIGDNEITLLKNIYKKKLKFSEKIKVSEEFKELVSKMLEV